jgi:hypothetical protein
MNSITKELKIVSGGQSGADQAALDWAIANSIPHGGWCPKGRKSEDGKINPKYQLTETPSASYLERTEWNVRDSDATIIFTLSPTLSGGSKRTMELAQKLGKPCMHFRQGVAPKWIQTFLEKNNVKVLNIAGPRASGVDGIEEFVTSTLNQVFNEE